MVVMRCISVQQIVRSGIQAGRKILQQLNRVAAVSRFNFCKMVRTNVQHYTQLFLRNPLLFPQIADTSAEFFCIKSHCSILSFAPKTQTGRDSFSESRPVFSLKMHNDHDSMELLLWAAHGVLSAFHAFQAIFPLAQLKLAPWRYYSKYFHFCKALKYTVFAAVRNKFTQQTHKNEYLHSNYTYFTINSFQKHQYVLVCGATISNFLRFSQVSFSRFHAKNWTLLAFNKRI